ncbi:MAG: hypothetical protein M1812_005512 [Candelaria pacifica]|nr:MAG: hypothetical protein M1812_005512 [Candelaria pacifica]
MKCLCEEAEFQNAVFQCLYSQCQTTQFGSALHYALSECFNYGSGASTTPPRLIRHDNLHKRQDHQPRYASVSASASAFHSVHRRYAGSTIPAYSLPTQSADVDLGRTYYVRKHRMVYSTAVARTSPPGVSATPTAMANVPML